MTDRRQADKLLVILLTALFIINLLNGVFTEILSDEAYYKLYAEHLDWGYFDHPPLTGFLVFISGLLFKGELGVRFMTILLQPFTIWFIWLSVRNLNTTKKEAALFFILCCSFVMLSAYGFITTPDAPLLFFTALFLLFYKKYITEGSFQDALIMGVSMAGMAYSKYHAFIIIGLVVLSNIKLLKQGKFWTGAVIAIILYIPHILWQASMNFPTLQFHMVSRTAQFKIAYLLEYWPNQLAVFNPFTLFALFYAIFKYPIKDQFEKTLVTIVAGMLLFFWAMGFKQHVEPHWTVAASLPALILLFEKTKQSNFLKRYTRKFILPSLVLIFLARIVLVTNLLPERFGFNGKEAEYIAAGKIAGDLPVVYSGSFQGASLYHFFTGKPSFVLSSVTRRKTQFDFWQLECEYQNKPVVILNGNMPGHQEITIDGYSLTAYRTNNFQSVSRMSIDFSLPGRNLMKNDSITVSFTIHNPYTVDIDFNHEEFPVSVSAVYNRFKKTYLQACHLIYPVGIIKAGDSVSGILTTVVPELDDVEYKFALSLTIPFNTGFNSDFVPVEIK